MGLGSHGSDSTSGVVQKQTSSREKKCRNGSRVIIVQYIDCWFQDSPKIWIVGFFRRGKVGGNSEAAGAPADG